ncbi:hypothetical protein BB558_005870 [Smittium angustum]|uniref:SH3 domain-containing protein n=1 Tax=Smittium angustum TaxID=133377 RepID=A0A2U1IZA6_SMIAN|nr:hypothetical protein BB558_005870 [Smittium angustum]
MNSIKRTLITSILILILFYKFTNSQDSNIPDLSNLIEMLGGKNGTASNSTISGNQCFSLENSKICGEYFKTQSLPIINSKIDSVDEFDSMMIKYFNSNMDKDGLKSSFGCNNLDYVEAPRLRIPFICRGLLETSAAKECNKDNENKIQPICRNTCLEYVDNWEKSIVNYGNCPDIATVRRKVKDFMLVCSTFPFNGDNNSGCLSFSNIVIQDCDKKLGSIPNVCKYCSKSPSDPCCNSSNIKISCMTQELNRSNKTAIANLVLQAAILALLVLLAILYAIIQKKRRKKDSLIKSIQFKGDNDQVFSKSFNDSKLTTSVISLPTNSETFIIAEKMKHKKQDPKTLSTITNNGLNTKPPNPYESKPNNNTRPPSKIAEPKTDHRQQSIDEKLVPVRELKHLKTNMKNDILSLSKLSTITTPDSKELIINTPESKELNISNKQLVRKSNMNEALFFSNKESIQSAFGSTSGSSYISIEHKALENNIFSAIYPYNPREYDELEIKIGDRVKAIKVFSDGWALVEHQDNGKAGVIPIVCFSGSKPETNNTPK